MTHIQKHANTMLLFTLFVHSYARKASERIHPSLTACVHNIYTAQLYDSLLPVKAERKSERERERERERECEREKETGRSGVIYWL